jgi:hypothetical protein
MPSVSKKQHNFMEAVAHNAAFAKKAGVPQSVGKDFSTADKGKKFAKGGLMAKSQGPKPSPMGKVRTADDRQSWQEVNHDAQSRYGGSCPQQNA